MNFTGLMEKIALKSGGNKSHWKSNISKFEIQIEALRINEINGNDGISFGI